MMFSLNNVCSKREIIIRRMKSDGTIIEEKCPLEGEEDFDDFIAALREGRSYPPAWDKRKTKVSGK